MTYFYYFSPTGGTEKTGEIFCRAISETQKAIDLGRREKEVEAPEGDLAVFAAPVFGGRIPELVTKKLKKLNGNGKKAVTLAVYGNRAYEDALLELNRIVEGQGFQILASSALIAQHSIVPDVGRGRPDAEDRREILDFAQKVLDKLRTDPGEPVKVPGNYPYKESMRIPAPPISLPSCSQCGKCMQVCPTGAISLAEGEVATDAGTCILCMACTAACPQQVRVLPPPVQESMEQRLGALKAVRRENEFFF